MQITTIGVDLAKNVFQVHGIAENDKVSHISVRIFELLVFSIQSALFGS